jgi:hypothetical protein
VRALLVVLSSPLPDELPDPSLAPEQMQIEHLVSQAPVEPLDERILIGLPGLDAINEHTIGLTPVNKDTDVALDP